MTTVAALYVDPRGPYPKLLGPELCWDETRDARTYAGPWPVVAHPPCGPWGRLSHLCTKQPADLGIVAFGQVRRWGGVLEQPAWSRLFSACGAPPGQLGRLSNPDKFGGSTIEVNQADFGHVARKPTWLYLVGVRWIPELPPRREPTHWIGGGRGPRKACSAQQRRRTPSAFAMWLIGLAERARR